MINNTYADFANDQAKSIYFYGLVILLPIGLFVNLKSFVIYQADTFENEYTAFHYSLQVILKSVALVWDILIYKYLPLNKINIAGYSEFSCFIFGYISRVITQLPYYEWSFLTYLNYLSVFNPSRQRYLSKKFNFLTVTLLITLALLVINISSAFNYIQVYYKNNQTQFECKSKSNTTEAISLIISSISRFLIPFILINYFNFKPVRTLIDRKLINNGSIEEEKKLVKKYIFFDLMYIMINLPFAILEIINAIIEYIYEHSPDSILMLNIRVGNDIARVVASFFYFFTNLLGFVFNRFEREYLYSLPRKIFCKS